jgi:hypothetical protein
VPIALVIMLYFVFKKYKKAGKVMLYTSAAVMLVLRIVKYLYFKPIYWNEGWGSIVPYELCTILSYILPFTVFLNTKKLNKFIYPLAIIGGVVTMAYSEWIFNGQGLNFNKFESLIVHILLIAIPYFSAAVGRFSFKIKDFFKPVIAMAFFVGYAYIANTYITPGANHMFIRVNPLPINFPVHHMYFFAAFFLIVLFLMYAKDVFRKRRK